MLAIANDVPDHLTNVIVDISRQSLRVASLILEYTELSLRSDSLVYFVKLQV